ncbi:hypothetical protein MKW92_008748 [Papaver armeniacum]|nr:hypothetical protein MKW92_008748 [Papaver armeniacum]
MYRSCKKILEMDDDFVDSDAMMLTFVWETEDSGSRETVELCPGGSNIVQRPRKNFFRCIELKDLDCVLLGSNLPISVKDWKAHTVYEGYTEADDQIHWFWKVVEGMSMEQQRELLFFLDLSEIPSSKWFFWIAISFDHLQDIWL